MSTVTDTHRICTTCYERKPIDMFRRRRAGSEERRHECRTCHVLRCNTGKRERNAKRDRRIVATAMAEIRRRNSAEGVLAIVEQVAGKMGGMNAFAARWAELIELPTTPVNWKVKSCRTLVEMLVVAEKHRTRDWKEAEPLEVLRDLHQRRVLLGALRELVESGELPFDELLDGVDPPPERDPQYAGL